MITPKRPYLIRAFHEWMQDNDYTPYLMIDATHNDLHAPLQYAQDGRLVLAASYQSKMRKVVPLGRSCSSASMASSMASCTS